MNQLSGPWLPIEGSHRSSTALERGNQFCIQVQLGEGSDAPLDFAPQLGRLHRRVQPVGGTARHSVGRRSQQLGDVVLALSLQPRGQGQQVNEAVAPLASADCHGFTSRTQASSIVPLAAT